jgi:lipoprotein-anchoring transpeptidase ErfK/SrfK
VSRRFFIPLFLAVLLLLLLPARHTEARAGARSHEPADGAPPLIDDGVICVSRLVRNDPHACPPYGPATTAARIAGIRLPDPLPDLAVAAVETPEGSVTPYTYAEVIKENAPVYGHPVEASYGLPPKRRLGVGYIWVSLQGKTTYEGRDYYQINANEFVPAEDLRLNRPSTFQGVALAQQPERPFAWILRAVQPRVTPGGDINGGAPTTYRYQLVQIFATEHRGDQVWYLIGPDQWINQVYVGKVERAVLPAGVSAGAAWIDINLFEQTLAAYVGDRLVYATLVSSGLPGWNTPPGLFQVWQKVKAGRMSGADGRPDYYFLEDVPWTLYFNQDVALHGAYWHDGFGYRHSHGCVNLAPLDARWLFEWAPEVVWVRVKSGEELAAN